MKKLFSVLLSALLLMGTLTGCGGGTSDTESEKLSIVTTIFPEYDWVMNVLGDMAADAELTMLLDSGVDLHSYQPTADDMIAIAACIGTELCLLPSMLTAALAVLGGLFILMTVSKTDVNGADLKLALACTFMLGLGRGLIGLTIGLVIAIAVNLVKLKNKKEGFPLIPYLAVGYMAAYLI